MAKYKSQLERLDRDLYTTSINSELTTRYNRTEKERLSRVRSPHQFYKRQRQQVKSLQR